MKGHPVIVPTYTRQFAHFVECVNPVGKHNLHSKFYLPIISGKEVFRKTFFLSNFLVWRISDIICSALRPINLI